MVEGGGVVCLNFQNGFMGPCGHTHGCLTHGGMESLFEKVLHGHVLRLVDSAGTLYSHICGYIAHI